MRTFKEGKQYECIDSGISPVLIIKRTKKMCLVQNDEGVKWRMMIRVDAL